LVGALVLYAVFGTAPLYLPTLPLIVASRVGVGIAEAAIMTCCTTLLADYFAGPRRDRYFGLQVVFTTLSATVFFAAGGGLGAISWRAPFWLYSSSLAFAVLVAVFIWQPKHPRDTAAESAPSDRGLPRIPWRTLAGPCAVSLFGGIAFYALIVELSYVLDAIGVTSVAGIGRISAGASLATAVGGFTFGRISQRGPAFLLPLAFGATGLGLVVVGASRSLVPVIVGAVVASYGAGLLLPAMLTWAVSSLSFEERGRGTGIWTSAVFLGEFVCPLLLLAIGGVVGGLFTALALLGAACLLMALGVRLAKPARQPV
jgi:MFS family permease